MLLNGSHKRSSTCNVGCMADTYFWCKLKVVVFILFNFPREPEAKWNKSRSPPSPRMKTTVVKKRSGLVQQFKDMCNLYPKSRLPNLKFATNDEFEREVMEGVLR